MDRLFEFLTLTIIPLFAITTSIRSEIIIVYALLYGLQTWRSGFRWSGLEWFALAAVLGLAFSAADVRDPQILKKTFQTAKILALPVMMTRFRVSDLTEKTLPWIFGALAVYGIARLHLNPLVTGYAQDRPYCFSDFFMHSSLIAVSGYLYFLVGLACAPGLARKAGHTAGLALFLYLIAAHKVRASYLSVALLTPTILLVEARRIGRRGWIALGLTVCLAGGALLAARPALLTTAAARMRSIADLKDGSNRGRLTVWRRAWGVFTAHPVNGIGFRRFNRSVMRLENPEHEWAFAHAHNEILGLLAETGLVGTLAWLAFKLRLGLCFLRARHRRVGAWLLGLFLAFEIHNAFEYYLYERIAYIYVYLIFGLGLAALASRPDQPDGTVTA